MRAISWMVTLGLALALTACDDDEVVTDAGPGDAGRVADGGDAGAPPIPGRTAVTPIVPQLTPEDIPGGVTTMPETRLTLFYPGEVSYFWLLGGTQPGSTVTHAGAAAVQAGTACRTCHVEGGSAPAPAQLGAMTLQDIDSAPIAGKPPTVDVDMRFAYDDEFLYVQATWEGDAEPGDVHAVHRYDAATGEWVEFGGPRNPTADPPIYEDRFTFLFGHERGTPGYVTADDGVTHGFQEHGCFITCHNSMRDMPLEATGSPLVGEVFPRQSDIRKYLLITREEPQPGDPTAGTGVTAAEGAWALLKAQDTLDAMRAEGRILDHFHWRAARTNPIGYSDDTWVFDYRRGDAGRAAWIGQTVEALNEAAAGTNPGTAFMWNPAVVSPQALAGGTYAIRGGADPLGALEAASTTHVLALLNESAIPYDSSVYTPEDNDLIIEDVLQLPEASHADIIADGRWALDPATGRGRWTVVLRRALDTGNPDDIALVEGEVYPIAFSIHDDNVTTRHHWVSLEYTLGIGTAAGAADITATRVAAP